MRLVMLSTSAAFHPSPRGRWLPLARHLVQAGVQVTWIGLHPHFVPGHAMSSIHDGVDIHHVAQMHVTDDGPLHGWRLYWASLVAIIALTRHTITCRPDVICICKAQPHNGIAAVVAQWVTGARLIVDSDDDEAASHAFAHPWQRHVVAWCERVLTCRATSVSTASSVLAARAQHWGARVVAHIATGITVPSTDDVIPYPLPDRYLVYVGNLSRHAHALDLLLQALSKRTTHFPLVIAGSGHDAAALHQYAHDLGVAADCIWLGAIPASHVAPLLRGAVASIDPIRPTAAAAARFPLKILESLAVGTPVITSPDGDRAALVGDAGMLVPAGDADALAHACDTIMTQQFERAHIQRRVRHLDWTHVATMWGRLHQLL